jgi:hypothetical protein
MVYGLNIIKLKNLVILLKYLTDKENQNLVYNMYVRNNCISNLVDE